MNKKTIITASMKEIKLYHKVWVFLLVLLIMLALTIVYLIPIIRGNNSSFWIWNWFLLLFSGFFFCGVYSLYFVNGYCINQLSP